LTNRLSSSGPSRLSWKSESTSLSFVLSKLIEIHFRYKSEVAKSNAEFEAHTTNLHTLQQELDKCLEEMQVERENYLQQAKELDETMQELGLLQEKLTNSEERCASLEKQLEAFSKEDDESVKVRSTS
jgi:chromosome segregation ATPase